MINSVPQCSVPGALQQLDDLKERLIDVNALSPLGYHPFVRDGLRIAIGLATVTSTGCRSGTVAALFYCKY